MASSGGSSAMPNPTLNNEDETLKALESLFEPPTDAACSFGDIILVADDKLHPICKIQVSSCILSMVSPVFRALFSKKFAEGQGSSTSGPKEIRLEEDPRAVRVLCRLLHHQPPGVDEKGALIVDPLSLAILADKYDCVEALRMPVKGLFDMTRRYFDDFDGVCDSSHFDIAIAAYIFDQAEIFRDITKALVLHSNSITPQSFSSRCQDFLPPLLASSLGAQLRAAQNEIVRHVGTLFQSFCAAAAALQKHELTADLAESLEANELLPIIQNDKSNTLFKIFDRLQDVRVPIMRPDGVSCHCSTLSKTEFKSSDLPEKSQARARMPPYDGWASRPASPAPPARPEREWKSIGGERPSWHYDKLCFHSSSHYQGSEIVVESHDFEAIVKNVRGCIVGVCADCVDGKEGNGVGAEGDTLECRAPHPKPWNDILDCRTENLGISCFPVKVRDSDFWGIGDYEYDRPDWWQDCW